MSDTTPGKGPEKGPGSGAIAGSGGIGGVTGGAETGQRVFVRKASGLIKSASNTDVFIFDIGLVSVGMGAAFLFYFGLAAYPGANLYISILIAGILMMAIGGGLICWTVTIPRSGGIYVFASRSMWPSVAFMLSFVEVCGIVFYSAFAAYYVVQIGIAPMVSTIGIIQNSPDTVAWGSRLATPAWTFGIAAGLEIFGAWLLISGMRNFFRAQKIAFIVAITGTFVTFGTFLAINKSQFEHNFNRLMASQMQLGNHPYQGIMRSVQALGVNLTPHFSLGETILFMNWPFILLIGSAFSIGIGGEIRQVTTAQRNGIFGGILLSCVLWLIYPIVLFHAISPAFMRAVNYASFYGTPARAVTPVVPYYTFLAGIGTASVVMLIIISVQFMCWNWLWIPSQLGYMNRGIFAWALDRVFPDSLSKVNNRTHTPINAILLSLVYCLVILYLLVYTSWLKLAVFTELYLLAWSVTLVAGIFFPYRHKDMFEKGPIANLKVFGLPLFSVACGIGAVAGFLACACMGYDGIAAGHGRTSLIILGSYIVGGYVLYWIMFFWRRSQGIDVRLAFKQIPVE